MSIDATDKDRIEQPLEAQIYWLSFHEQHAGRLVVDPEYVRGYT